jgi:hypothetical protein
MRQFAKKREDLIKKGGTFRNRLKGLINLWYHLICRRNLGRVQRILFAGPDQSSAVQELEASWFVAIYYLIAASTWLKFYIISQSLDSNVLIQSQTLKIELWDPYVPAKFETVIADNLVK